MTIICYIMKTHKSILFMILEQLGIIPLCLFIVVGLCHVLLSLSGLFW